MQNSQSKIDPTGSATFLVIACLFFASGFSSLIYQVVWSRLLVFVFGSTTFATASVLAVFMGGLALGSFLAGKMSDRLRNPLLYYGILEGIVGIWAIFVPSMLHSFIPFYKTIYQQFHLDPLSFASLRFLVASAVLILPTACMGATLPFVSKHVAQSEQTIGFRVGSLYAVNTFGAVCGAALAGFILIPLLGLKVTTWAAAAINMLLCLAVLFLARASSSSKPDAPAITTNTSTAATNEAVPVRTEPAQTVLAPKLIWATFAFAFSGALAMIYEVGWTRALLLVIGAGTYAFTCMLTTFLIGIFLGSWVCSRYIDKSKDALLVFAVLQIGVSICALAALYSYSFLPIVNLILGAFLAVNADAAIAVKFAVAAATFVPLTFCLGATFPAIVKACVHELSNLGRSVGTLYSANTCGAIFGAFLAGFLLVPLLGVEKMLFATAIANFILGCSILYQAPTAKPRWRAAGLALSCGLTILAVLTPEIWDHRLLLMAQPLQRNHTDPRSIAGILFDPELRKQALDLIDLRYFADGISSNVGVLKTKQNGRLLLVTNGNMDGGDGLDMSTQILLSLFPFMVKPDIKDACVIGYGTGVSSGTALCFPVQKVINVELEKKVYDAGKLFDHVNNKPENDPRSHFERDDGRNYLLATNQKFDLIVSEPSNPWQAGVCNLYTSEYFRICRNDLKPGGLLSCWLQTTELSPTAIRSVLASVRSSFRQVLVFGTGKGPDIVILASDSPLKVDYETIEKAFTVPKVKLQLSRANLLDPAEVAACIVADNNTVDAICKGTTANSDDRNYLEYTVCKTYETSNYRAENLALFDNKPVAISDVIQSGKIRSVADLAQSALEANRPQQALLWASSSLALKTDTHLTNITAELEWQLGNHKKAFKLWNAALALDPNDDSTMVAIAKAAISESDRDLAMRMCQTALARNPANRFANYSCGVEAASANEWLSFIANPEKYEGEAVIAPDHVISYLDKVCNDDKFVLQYPNALLFCAAAHSQLNDQSKAEELLHNYLKIKPDSSIAKRFLGSVLWQGKKRLPATCLWAGSFALERQQSLKMAEQAEKLIDKQRLHDGIELLAKSLERWPANYKSLKLLRSVSEKDKEAAELLEILENTGAANEARHAEPKDDNVEKLIELGAAAYLLFLVLKKGRTKK